MTEVKICGIRTAEAAEAAQQSGAAMIGFIVYPKSPRHISPQRYGELASSITHSETVLVTVNATDAVLDEYCALSQPDYVQCHGQESPQRLEEIRARGVKIIKAISIAEAADLAQISTYQDAADLLLLDAKPAKGELPGGNAKSFDWSILKTAELPKRWMLSGGLNADNIEAALRQTHAPMIDLSSGVESAPGVKDAAKIRALRAQFSRY